MSRPPRPVLRPPQGSSALEEGEDFIEEVYEGEAPAPSRAALRAELRGDPRESDRESLRLAEIRAKEIMGDLGDDFDDAVDEFAVDPRDVPVGWTYEWKRWLNVGAEDPAYEVAVRRKGWTPVPASRHPSYMPSNMRDGPITRKGMMLMERPKSITDKVRDRETLKARLQILNKERQLNQTPEGHLERSNKDRSLVQVKKSYEPIEIPEDD